MTHFPLATTYCLSNLHKNRIIPISS